MASASAPASGLAVQLPARASSLAVLPPAARIVEAVDLSAGAAILEDLGPAAAAAAASTHHFIIYHISAAAASKHNFSCNNTFLSLQLLLFYFLVSYFAGCVRTYSYMGSDTVMYQVLSLLLLYPA